MTSKTTRMAWALAIALGLGGAGLPGAAWAEDEVGIVLSKDAEAKTLTLEGGRVLHVTPRTVLMGLSGQRITFAELPQAVSRDGGFELDGDEGILYEARRTGRIDTADRIQILGTIPD